MAFLISDFVYKAFSRLRKKENSPTDYELWPIMTLYLL